MFETTWNETYREVFANILVLQCQNYVIKLGVTDNNSMIGQKCWLYIILTEMES